MKLYVDEEGHGPVPMLATIVVGEIARVEVPAAFWRKHRIGESEADDARILTADFEAGYYGTPDDEPRFAVVRVTADVLDDAARLCDRYPLRANAAIQLASALAVRVADPATGTLAVFDAGLRRAATAEGSAVVPPALGSSASSPGPSTVVPPLFASRAALPAGR